MIAIEKLIRINHGLILFFQPDSDFLSNSLRPHARGYRFLGNLLTSFATRVQDRVPPHCFRNGRGEKRPHC
jgi:hypothetical protein